MTSHTCDMSPASSAGPSEDGFVDAPCAPSTEASYRPMARPVQTPRARSCRRRSSGGTALPPAMPPSGGLVPETTVTEQRERRFRAGWAVIAGVPPGGQSTHEGQCCPTASGLRSPCAEDCRGLPAGSPVAPSPSRPGPLAGASHRLGPRGRPSRNALKTQTRWGNGGIAVGLCRLYEGCPDTIQPHNVKSRGLCGWMFSGRLSDTKEKDDSPKAQVRDEGGKGSARCSNNYSPAGSGYVQTGATKAEQRQGPIRHGVITGIGKGNLRCVPPQQAQELIRII